MPSPGISFVSQPVRKLMKTGKILNPLFLRNIGTDSQWKETTAGTRSQSEEKEQLDVRTLPL